MDTPSRFTEPRYVKFGFFLFVWIVSWSARAQDILVEATAINEERIEPSRSASIVTGKDILSQKPQTVADALRSIPGVEVIRQGGIGQTASLFIRGARSEDTLVLIDGMEANDAMSPACGFDFSSLSPDNIERIEVYHGPQSVRFGAGALGGVVNIVTKEGSASSLARYSLEGGSYHTFKSGVGTSGKSNRFAYSIGVESLTTEGYSAAAKKGGEADGAKVYSGSAKLIYAPSMKIKIEGTARYNYAAVEIDTQGGVGGDDPNNTTLAKQFVSGLLISRRFFEERLKSNLGFYFSELDRKGRNKADGLIATDSSDHFLSESTKVQSDHSLIFGDHHELRLSFQWRVEGGRSKSTFNGTATDISRKTQSVAGEGLTYLFETETWFYDVGARLDQSDTVGNIPSYRASAGRFLNEKRTKAFMSYGTGFKLPSLYQLYSSYGDKDLSEENSDTVEGTVQQDFSKIFSSSITLFENHYKNLIDFNLSTNKYYNIAKARTKGIEIESSIKPTGSLIFTGRYTYLDAEDETTGLVLLRRPRNTWSISSLYTFGKWESSIDYRFRGERQDIDPVTFQRIDAKAYDLINVGASYLWSKQFKVNARIENIFDRSYEEVAGYGTARLSVFAGISGEI